MSGVCALLLAVAQVPALATTAGPAAPSTGTTTQALTETQASALAHRTGKRVPVTAEETSTSTLTANPNGSYTVSVTPAPVRKKVNGTWRDLNATLTRNPDGTISPTLAADPLVLSGGGHAPLATMRHDVYALSLTEPTDLPTPTLSGDTATYHDVLPGVDLVVTATTVGGFSDVYVIHDAAAAANPKLGALLTANVTTKGLTVSTDQAGDIRAETARGQQIFAAPAPEVWDSATSGGGAASTTVAPGTHAHHGSLAAGMHGNTLTLTPDASVLHGSHTEFPVFADPSWSALDSGWATVAENYPNDNHWDSSAESQGYMQTGQADTGFWADTLLNYDLPGVLGNDGTSVSVTSATLYLDSVAADSCTAQAMDVYAPGATLTSGNATWNNWFTSGRNLGGAVGSGDFAYGWSGSCAAQSVGIGLSTGWITNDMNSGKGTQTLALAGTSYGAEQFTGDGGGQNQYHDFAFTSSSPDLSVSFIHAPATPTNLTTSPNESTIGNGTVTLNADVSDPDGGALSVTFDAYVTGKPADVIASGTVSAGSGTGASLQIQGSTLDADVVSTAYGGTSGSTTMPVTWTVSASNGTQTSGTASGSFTYDTAIPGAPTIYTDAGDTTECPGSGAYTVGTAATFHILPAAGQGSPTNYSYQLNGMPAQTVAAASGNTTIQVTPTTLTNVLTVNGLSAGNNIGQPQTCVFSASTPGDAADGDLTGTGEPDLLLPGTGSAALPAGLWLSPGLSSGSVTALANDIGTAGTDLATTANAANASDYTGTQAISGLFSGAGFNDILDYDPATPQGSPNGGVCTAEVMDLDGQTLPIQPQDDGHNANSNAFTYYQAKSGSGYTDDCATSVAEAGPLTDTETGFPAAVTTGVAAGYPDLLEIANGTLYLVPTGHEVANWGGIGSSDNSQPGDAHALSATNPAGSPSWGGWTITTALVGNLPAMFAANNATGALYYYNPTQMAQLAYDAVNSTTTYTVTPVELAASGYSNTTYIHLQAANLGGTVDLWTITPSGVVGTAQLNAAGTALATHAGSTTLVTTSHNWGLNDMPAGGDNQPVTTSADTSANPLPLTGHGGPTWNTGDTFSPDMYFSGTNSWLTTGAPAVTPTADFTISAWVDPVGDGGVILSQNGASTSDFILYPFGSQWEFGINTDNGNSWSFNGAIAGLFTMNTWSQLTLTFNAADTTLTLYDNGTYAGAVSAPSAPSTTGDFLIGADQNGGSAGGGSPFQGQIADVQVWNSLQPPIPAPTHEWELNDAASGAIGTNAAADSAAGGNLPLSGNGGTTWNTSGSFAPDASFNGSSGVLSTNAPALDVSASFTTSLWAYPTGYGIALSQDGSQTSGFMVYADGASGHWAFALAQSDGSGWNYDWVLGPSVQLDTWALITATYDAGTDVMSLYVNGGSVAARSHSPVAGFTGWFRVGDYLNGGAYTGYWPGQLARVRVWNTALTADQVAALN